MGRLTFIERSTVDTSLTPTRTAPIQNHPITSEDFDRISRAYQAYIALPRNRRGRPATSFEDLYAFFRTGLPLKVGREHLGVSIEKLTQLLKEIFGDLPGCKEVRTPQKAQKKLRTQARRKAYAKKVMETFLTTGPLRDLVALLRSKGHVVEGISHRFEKHQYHNDKLLVDGTTKCIVKTITGEWRRARKARQRYAEVRFRKETLVGYDFVIFCCRCRGFDGRTLVVPKEAIVEAYFRKRPEAKIQIPLLDLPPYKNHKTAIPWKEYESAWELFRVQDPGHH